MDLVLGSRPRKLMFPITGIVVHTIWRIYSAIVYQMSWQDESNFSLDKHLFCTKCCVSECSMNTRCNECM